MEDAQCAVVFPINRQILWAREPTSKPHYVHAREVAPPLFISPGSLASLLKSCKNSVTNSVEKAVSIATADSMIEGASSNGAISQGPWKTWLEKSVYALSLSEDGNEKNTAKLCGPSVASNLTIPVSSRTSWNDDLTFDKETTRYVAHFEVTRKVAL